MTTTKLSNAMALRLFSSSITVPSKATVQITSRMSQASARKLQPHYFRSTARLKMSWRMSTTLTSLRSASRFGNTSTRFQWQECLPRYIKMFRWTTHCRQWNQSGHLRCKQMPWSHTLSASSSARCSNVCPEPKSHPLRPWQVEHPLSVTVNRMRITPRFRMAVRTTTARRRHRGMSQSPMTFQS